MANNHPPFAIGQKVVSLKTSKCGLIVKGGIYTVANCFLSGCACQKHWLVAVLETPASMDVSMCIYCGTINTHRGTFHLIGSAKYFAPYNPPAERIRIERVAVSETLREKAIEIAAIETN